MAFVGRVNFANLLERALFVQAVGDGDGFAVIGEGDVFVAQRAGRGGHLLDGVSAVAGGGVHLQVAANVGEFDEVREAMFFGGFDLAGVFAQLGRNEIELELGVDLFFGGAGDAPSRPRAVASAYSLSV